MRLFSISEKGIMGTLDKYRLDKEIEKCHIVLRDGSVTVRSEKMDV